MTFTFDGTGQFPKAAQGQSKLIYRNNKTIVKATLTATDTKADGDIISYEMGMVTFDANDNETGTTWEEVQSGVPHVFANIGTGLKFKAILVGNGGSQTRVTKILINGLVEI